MGLIEDTSNDTEKMVEVSLDSLSLTWGTAWEASHMIFVTQKLGLRVAGFRQVLDLDFFTSAEVMHFTKRAPPGSFVLHGRQGSCCIMSHPVGRWREP